MRPRWRVVAGVFGWVLSLALVVTGQTIYNPRILQFDAIDHEITSSYRVEVWLQAADPVSGAPIQTSVLAKDKAARNWCPVQPCIPEFQANLSDLTPLFGVPVGQSYVVRMVAVGLDPVQVSPRSDPSGPFELAGVPRSVVNLRLK